MLYPHLGKTTPPRFNRGGVVDNFFPELNNGSMFCPLLHGGTFCFVELEYARKPKRYVDIFITYIFF